MTGVVATGLRGPGAVSISSKVPGGNIHAAPNTQGEGELFVLCLFVGVLPIMILAQYCVMKDRLIYLRSRNYAPFGKNQTENLSCKLE